MQTLMLDNLPTPVLLVWGLPEDAHDSLMFMGGRILTYDTSVKTVAIRLSRRHDEYWQLIGKLSEVTEEQYETVVTKVMNNQHYQNYNYKSPNERWTNTAKESFFSKLEAEGYFVLNPHSKTHFNPEEYIQEEYERFMDAQSKTLPANTLIFKRA